LSIYIHSNLHSVFSCRSLSIIIIIIITEIFRVA